MVQIKPGRRLRGRQRRWRRRWWRRRRRTSVAELLRQEVAVDDDKPTDRPIDPTNQPISQPTDRLIDRLLRTHPLPSGRDSGTRTRSRLPFFATAAARPVTADGGTRGRAGGRTFEQRVNHDARVRVGEDRRAVAHKRVGHRCGRQPTVGECAAPRDARPRTGDVLARVFAVFGELGAALDLSAAVGRSVGWSVGQIKAPTADFTPPGERGGGCGARRRHSSRQ